MKRRGFLGLFLAPLAGFIPWDNTPEMEVKKVSPHWLRASWTYEAEQDLESLHGIDIDKELCNAMSYEIQKEIDREVITKLLKSATL